MKVLIFMSQFYRLGGSERLAVELAEQLNRRGIRSDLLSMYSEGIPGVAEAKKELLERRGIPRVGFLELKVNPSLPSMFPAIRTLKQLIREGGYDIVETSMISPTVLAAWATLGTATRQVAGIHHTFSREFENAPRHKAWLFTLKCNPRVRFYAISDCASQSWHRYSGRPTAQIRTIYNAIPDHCFEAPRDREGVLSELGIPRDARIALSVARLTRVKGLDTLLEAMSTVLEPHNIFLLCVGVPDFSVPGTAELLREIEKKGYQDRVRFLGFRKDVPRLMAAADVLLHPPRREGFCLALVEALAAGLPVVASAVEGIPEVLRGTGSLLVPPDDPKALREAALTALSLEPAERARLVAQGRERAEAFRIGVRVGAMVRLFEDVLQDRF